ncbi:MAG: hypothetical protein HPY50_19650 [Firmicutes bacterium]|nr:hypothetical protein [Bacillota bacterium]
MNRPVKRKSRVGLIIVLVVLVLLAITIGAVAWFSFENEFETTRETQLQEASVVGIEQDSDGYYVEVSVPGVSKNLFAQTTSEFYSQVYSGQKVGAMIGTIDKYKARESFDKLKLTVTYLSTDYEVLALYPSLAEAQAETKETSFTMPGTLVQRAKTQDGRYFFLMDAEGKRFMAEVNKDYYEKYVPKATAPNSFEMQFVGFGDFTRFDKIVKP